MFSILRKKVMALALLPMLGACTKFMEETSPDIVTPKTVAQYEELLYGGGYPFGGPGVAGEDGYNNLDVMTDLVAFNPVGGASSPWNADNVTYRALYRWEADMEQFNAEFLQGIWSKLYASIMVCNTVIDDLASITIPTFESAALRDDVRGQALLLRAFHYFTLATLFAESYRPAVDSEFGVPLKLEAGVDPAGLGRNSVHAVFRQIRSDIDLGLGLIDKQAFEIPHVFNYRAGLVLAARVALVMEDWDAVIRYGAGFIALHPTLAPLDGAYGEPNRFIQAGNPEVVFLYGAGNPVTLLYTGMHPGFVVDERIFDSYELDKTADERDFRPAWFFSASNSASPVLYPIKKLSSRGARGNAFRGAEVYLGLAEAYAHKGDAVKAVGLLNELRRSRIAQVSDLSVERLQGDALALLIKNERLRELCFEDQIRWMDLKRYNQPITHEWELAGQRYRTTLHPADYGFILQVPRAERDRNPSISIIPRPERQVEIIANN